MLACTAVSSLSVVTHQATRHGRPGFHSRNSVAQPKISQLSVTAAACQTNPHRNIGSTKRKTATVLQAQTHGIQEHIDAMRAFVENTGGTPIQITSHPIKFGSGEWTCVVGEFEGGGRMVTVAKWRDGAIAEEYIWM